jgi:hypothetical protein
MITLQRVSEVSFLTFRFPPHVSNLQNISERLIHDTLNTGTDDSVQQFTNSFIDLRQRFAEGSNISTSKIVRSIESGIVELGESLGRIEDFGQICHAHIVTLWEIHVQFT